MERYGLLGEHLGHSFSPRIHAMLCGYEYKLYEQEKENVPDFLNSCGLDGMNVTIPYKKDVLPHCVWLSDAVKRIGSANTLVKHQDGWHAYNTDYFGFRRMVESMNVEPAGKKAVILGSGGAMLAVRTALEDMGAKEIVVVSRGGENNYDNLHLHADAEIVRDAAVLENGAIGSGFLFQLAEIRLGEVHGLGELCLGLAQIDPGHAGDGLHENSLHRKIPPNFVWKTKTP